MAILDVVVPFAAVIVVGLWQLWVLRRDEKRRHDSDTPRSGDDER